MNIPPLADHIKLAHFAVYEGVEMVVTQIRPNDVKENDIHNDANLTGIRGKFLLHAHAVDVRMLSRLTDGVSEDLQSGQFLTFENNVHKILDSWVMRTGDPKTGVPVETYTAMLLQTFTDNLDYPRSLEPVRYVPGVMQPSTDVEVAAMRERLKTYESSLNRLGNKVGLHGNGRIKLYPSKGLHIGA